MKLFVQAFVTQIILGIIDTFDWIIQWLNYITDIDTGM